MYGKEIPSPFLLCNFLSIWSVLGGRLAQCWAALLAALEIHPRRRGGLAEAAVICFGPVLGKAIQENLELERLWQTGTSYVKHCWYCTIWFGSSDVKGQAQGRRDMLFVAICFRKAHLAASLEESWVPPAKCWVLTTPIAFEHLKDWFPATRQGCFLLKVSKR